MSCAFGNVLAREREAAQGVAGGGRHISAAAYPADVAGLSAADILHLSGSSSEATPSGRPRSLMDKLCGKGGWLIPDFRRVATAATLAVALQNAVVPGVAWAGPFTQTVDGETVTGEVIVLSGGSQGGSTQTVMNGGSAVNGTIGSSGGQVLKNLGSAIGTIIGFRGSQHVSSGGVAKDTTVQSGGSQIVSFGGLASGTNVSSGGSQFVSNGGSATSTVLNAGRQTVFSGGEATSTVINSNGYQYVSKGGTATSTVINSVGRQYVYGGEATDTVLSGGSQAVNSGGTVTHTTIYSGGQQSVSDALADDTTVHAGGSQHISSGGLATNTTLNGKTAGNSFGYQYVSSGGSASSTTVNSGGSQHVRSDAVATDTTLNSGGGQSISAGGFTTSTTINNGGKQFIYYGSASETTINSGGLLTVASGHDPDVYAENPLSAAVVTEVDQKEGGAIIAYVIGGARTVVEGVHENGEFSLRDGAADNFILNTSGILYVSSGGTTTDTTLKGGEERLYNGAKATNTTIESGLQTISSGGLAVDTTVNGGRQNVSSGGSATSTIVNGGAQNVFAGGSATDTTVNGGAQNLSGGSVTGTTVNGGAQNVYNGGLATSTVVNDGGSQFAYSGGTVEDTTIHSGGTLVMDKNAFLAGANNILHDGGMLAGESVHLLAGANLTIERFTDDVITTEFTGDGSLTKTGAGILYLFGANTYTGGTIVLEGALAGNTTSLQGDILNYADVIFFQDADGAYAGSMSGTGNLIKLGAGWLELLAPNPFSGDLVIIEGGVLLGPDGDVSNARTLYLHPGTTFDYSQAAAHEAASPMALKNITIGGLDTTINPGDSVADFVGANMHFTMPQSAQHGDIFLNVLGDADLTDVNVFLYTPSGRPVIGVEERLILVEAEGQMTSDITSTTVISSNGDSYLIETADDELFITLHEVAPTTPMYPRLKTFAQSRIAQAAFLDQGYELLLHQGMKTAKAATTGPGFQVASFGGVGGGWSKYKTGSHVEITGMELLLGVAVGADVHGGNDVDAPIGRVTGGLFFESGFGHHNTYSDFRNYSSAKGSGGITYYGGGLLGRYDVTSGPLKGLYGEASVRGGWSTLDFRTGDIRYNGWDARFDTSAMYYGAHAGLGHISKLPGLNDKATLHLSGKVLWTHLDSDAVTVYRDRVRFEEIDSVRTRLGGRFTYAVTEFVTPYAGAYWEHQFDGTQRMTVNGVRPASPTLRGSTAVGELGVSITPSKHWPVTIDLGIETHTGHRKGVTGSIQLRIDF